MYEAINRPHFGTLLARMPQVDGYVVLPQDMLPWLIELFGYWDDGRCEAVTASRAEIAQLVSARCQVSLPAVIPPGALLAPREERGEWLLQLAISVLSARLHVGDALADDCRRFLVHAHAWVQGV